jgi:DNA-binding NarL/FixJ family response regulator
MDGQFVAAALSTGASGYVFKRRLYGVLMPAIREALLGHSFVSLIVKKVNPPLHPEAFKATDWAPRGGMAGGMATTKPRIKKEDS